ncbi:hypothetical protein B0H14DRAFT_2637974 [Mycena olivaceomarginata]|nr:hypothetical protein B0H14DRAFT_2637974 [Mycena olivaceomarginata]
MFEMMNTSKPQTKMLDMGSIYSPRAAVVSQTGTSCYCIIRIRLEGIEMLHRTNFKIFLLLLRIHRSCCYCVPIQQDSIEAYIEAFQQFAGYDLDASRHSTEGIPPNELAAIVTAIILGEAYIEAFQQFAGYDLNASRHSTEGIPPNELAAIVTRRCCYCVQIRPDCIEAFLCPNMDLVIPIKMFLCPNVDLLFAFQLRTKPIIVAWSTSASEWDFGRLSPSRGF